MIRIIRKQRPIKKIVLVKETDDYGEMGINIFFHTKYFLDDNGVLRPRRIDQRTNSITFDFDK